MADLVNRATLLRRLSEARRHMLDRSREQRNTRGQEHAGECDFWSACGITHAMAVVKRVGRKR